MREAVACVLSLLGNMLYFYIIMNYKIVNKHFQENNPNIENYSRFCFQ